MASAASAPPATKGSLREDLTCAICCDLFHEPVMLACMHHFCKPCISRYWRTTHGPVTCPQCRREFSCRQFQTNFLVAAMVEKVRATSSHTYIKNLEVSSLPSLLQGFAVHNLFMTWSVCVFRFNYMPRFFLL